MVDFAADKKASGAPSFDAVVGQRDLKDGLLAVAADEGLDGLLIRGEKGTAKSTTVRALAELLPEQRAVADCPYSCPPDEPERQCSDCRERTDPPVERRPTPLVTLPLGATRDRVVGTLSVEDALAGEAEFDPGLLARANRGLLYVDEVNLLEDHLVDVVLDVAASGVNRVERDGVTVSHPADFTLVGTMNPEEGDLRPQLRDRFALQTEVTACDDIEDRVAIIDRALGDSAVTDGGGAADGTRSAALRLQTARERLPDVDLPVEFREQIADLCLEAGVDGHRGDIATARAARTFAALDDRTTVLEPDVERAARFALPHRLKSTPFEDAPTVDDVLDDQFDDESGDDGSDEDAEDEAGDQSDSGDGDATDGDGEEKDGERTAGDGDGSPDQPDTDGDGDDSDGSDSDEGESGEQPADGDDAGSDGTPSEADASDGGDDEPADTDDRDSSQSDEADEETAGPATPLLPGQSRADIGDSTTPEVDAPAVDTDGAGASGRANATDTDRGATVRTERANSDSSVDAAASVRAAARRGGDGVESRDLRQSVRAGDAETLVVFAVDASASMRPAMRAAKGCVLELLKDAYQARDAVSVVTFAGEDADVVLPPTDSVSLAARHLKDLPTGDRTPLPAGLATATKVLTAAEPDAAVAVIVTDGRANTADGSPVQATRDAAGRLGAVADRTIVVDAGTEGRAALTDTLADATDANVVPLSALTAERIDAAAR
ncbi:VWA domain-containing protein [Haloarcula salinisoli]|uniref:VWA domain-containing protein n=1 Tax=Haloarcula salinisoli TaxID=2487746 RepID=A0A8J7YRE3_9EURY|nr:VWA domain-containing protein [Halomicroarcula salinisoli]MBX0305948.1 VWA domain-containing protein [Halomicroarcula salinisoli]